MKSLRCRYHGRRFGLDGSFASMPEFDGTKDFPSPADNLAQLSLERWGPLLFTGLTPSVPFAEWIVPLNVKFTPDSAALTPPMTRSPVTSTALTHRDSAP